MPSLVGVCAGVAMSAGGLLAFRYAERLAGVEGRGASARSAASSGDAVVLKVALNRAVALGVSLLGAVTIALFAA